MPRKVTVIERKLKRHRAVGQAFLEDRLIELDPRQKPREWLGTLVHEALHIAFPDMEEAPIAAAEKKVLDILWRAGVRRVHIK
jgi:hypothetical protein